MTAGAGPLAPDEIIRLEPDAVVLLDQRALPGEERHLWCRSSTEVVEAIRTLAVRGAPAIGIAAAYGYALAAALGEDLDTARERLLAARPTAVNPAWALARLAELGDNPAEIARAARAIHAEEVERCSRMAKHAESLFAPGSVVLTHCNTGALATGGIGTALGAIVQAHEGGLVERAFADETRPLLQGSRLTAWELARAGVPCHVLVDSAAGALLARGEVTHVLVGADRIAANGDTANKIGTYSLAVLARHHDVPFVVVAPSSTVDLVCGDGSSIAIEERAGLEVTGAFPAWNPAFDVTPAGLVTAIVTEAGVHRAPYGPSLASAVTAAAAR